MLAGVDGGRYAESGSFRLGRFFTESLHSFYGVFRAVTFTENSQKIHRKFRENSQKIHRTFTENSEKIHRKFRENSEFFHDPRCLHCVLCAMRAGGIRPSLSSSFEVQAGNAQATQGRPV